MTTPTPSVDQPPQAVDLVNILKLAEESLLRMMDEMRDAGHKYDQRWLAIARTQLEQGYMALNRAILKPERVKLPGDDGRAAPSFNQDEPS